MRRITVKYGLKMIVGGIVAVILATFYHDQVARVLLLSPDGETQFVYLGLFWGAVLGFCGILVTVIGFLRAATAEQKVNLLPVLAALIIAVLIFFYLLFGWIRSPEEPRVRPGETITI
ncbi:MAG TPA: hypothetical protein VF775_07060 [Geobacteraceae bacterium]